MANAILSAIKSCLAHPDLRGLDIDDPSTTQKRRAVIQSNRFLWRIYDEWYRLIASSIPQGPGGVLEVGSGAGFLADYVAGVIASEVFQCPDIRVVLDARQLPFPPASLKAITMIDVFHHIADSRAFLDEARRCLRPGGSLVMIEPWVSNWSRLVWTRLHHEPFEPASPDWTFPASGPLSGANGALPWIVFERDRRTFETGFPEFQIARVLPLMPFRYLVSGGVSMRQLMPAFTFSFWRGLEAALLTWPNAWPMFAFIHLKRR